MTKGKPMSDEPEVKFSTLSHDVVRLDFNPFMDGIKLFCTYEGETYRCTGASRMGDVWLTNDTGYELRVNVEDCKEWRETWKQL